MIRLIVALALVGFALPVAAHEVYSDFFSGGAPGVGRWCCSGNLEGTKGDCAPASYEMNRDGSATFISKRYPGAEIRVPAHRILWMSIPGGEAFEAHICAVPRTAGVPPTEDDPDPAFVVFCAAIAPGGV